jgi:ankyrin repeat protein
MEPSQVDTRIEAFFDSIKDGDKEGVKSALALNPSLVNSRDKNGNSPVLTAIYYQEKEVAEVLIGSGALLNVFEAAAAGRLKRVRELVDLDASLANAFAPDGFQPLGLASFFGHQDVVEYLLGKGCSPDTHSRNGQQVAPLNSAAAGQHLGIARLLLDNGADPNAIQEGGFTPLHSAAQNGQVDMVRLLLERGADPGIRAQDGKTARDYALEAGEVEAAALL